MSDPTDRLDIIELINRYAAIIDLKQYDQVPRVFAVEAVADYSSMRVYVGDDDMPRGRDDIRRWLEQYTGQRSSMHMMHNHVVDVDGDRATLRAYMHNTNSSIVGIYYIDAIRSPEGWRIATLRLDERFVDHSRVNP